MKKRFSSNKIKFISSFLVGLSVMIITLTLTSFLMNKTHRDFELRYKESCTQVLEGYSSSLTWYLENYHTSLNSICNMQLFLHGKGEEVQKWMSDTKNFTHNDFLVTYYVDKDGTAYFSDGRIQDFSNKTYITKRSSSLSDYYISDILQAEFEEEPVIVIKRMIFSKDAEYRGTVCAAISLSTFEKITKQIEIESKCTVYLQDREGAFIVHPNKDYITKTYTPQSEKFKHVSSSDVSNSLFGLVKTENENGEEIDLFYKKIDNCGWTLGIAFPREYYNEIYTPHRQMRIFLFIISIVSLLLLILLENFVMDAFYKRQMIDTDYDSLTKLWTRQRFEKEATKLLHRYPRSKFMLIESDIRGFKFINQNYGEKIADEMIYFYSKLLNDCTNKFHGIIGRGYADHFYTFVKISEVRKAMSQFKKSMDEISEEVKNYRVQFFPKFGIAFLMPDDKKRDITIQGLIGQASFAKSTIKDNMLTQYSIYNSRLLEQINREHFIEASMEKALENHEFFVMYQPKINLVTDKIVGAEALVRWRNPTLGLLTPDKFIPLFERNGFITKLDFYVYEEVFKFLDAQLREQNDVVPISLNMSRNHSKPDKFMNLFIQVFKKYNIPPRFIQIEIIERSFMDNETLKDITNLLHKEGFSVAMDDFGSGESSLNMLTKIPVDVLKFDREFLNSSTKENGSLEEKSAKFIEILINLSKHLEKETIFEGVETKAQRDFLRKVECDQAQGFFYSKPLSEQDFMEFIRQHY